MRNEQLLKLILCVKRIYELVHTCLDLFKFYEFHWNLLMKRRKLILVFSQRSCGPNKIDQVEIDKENVLAEHLYHFVPRHEFLLSKPYKRVNVSKHIFGLPQICFVAKAFV